MIIDTSNLPKSHPRLTAATISENAHGTSTLSLQWAGWLPSWAKYMQPVTIRHKGRTLFHGKITSASNSNDEGAVTGSATVSNLLWVLDHSTLASQLAEIIGADNTSAPSDTLDRAACLPFASLARNISINADGWTPSRQDRPIITATASPALSKRHLITQSAGGKPISTFTALVKAMDAQPDVFILLDYEKGQVHLQSVTEAQHLPLTNTSARNTSPGQARIYTASDLAPQYESCITGVVLIVTTPDKSTGRQHRTIHKWPAGISPTDVGVKVFQVSGTGNPSVDASASSWWTKTAEDYYNAANVLQWGGSVTAFMDDFPTSPLGKRISLNGIGTHPEWNDMNAIVTSVQWDLLAKTITLGLGHEWSDPQFYDPEAPEDPEWDEQPDIPTTEDRQDSETPSWSSWPSNSPAPGWPTSGWPSIDIPTTAWPTTAWPTTAWPTTAWPTEGPQTFWPTATPPGHPTAWPTESTPTFWPTATPPGTPTDQPPGTPTGHPSGTPTDWPTGNPTGHPSDCCCCGCAEKWKELEKWKKDIEDRLKALEDSTCDCVDQVRAAIDEALANAPAPLGGSSSSTAQQNANGTITVTTTWKY